MVGYDEVSLHVRDLLLLLSWSFDAVTKSTQS